MHIDYSGRARIARSLSPVFQRSVLMYRGSEHMIPTSNCRHNGEQPSIPTHYPQTKLLVSYLPMFLVVAVQVLAQGVSVAYEIILSISGHRLNLNVTLLMPRSYSSQPWIRSSPIVMFSSGPNSNISWAMLLRPLRLVARDI